MASQVTTAYYLFISPCPLPQCDEYVDIATEWIRVACDGRVYLGDNGCFICEHMVKDCKKSGSCPKGAPELQFNKTRFICDNHGQVPLPVLKEHVTQAMFKLKEVAFLKAPPGIEKKIFMRWLSRASSAIVSQYQ